MQEKIRFGLVGIVNTATDFAVLFLLASVFGVATFAANIVSTSCGLAVSYLLNKKAVFRDTNTHNYRQIILFVTVTLGGLWALQGAVIWAVLSVLPGWLHVGGDVALLLAKAVATLFSLVWNYLWYSRVVFRTPKDRAK